MYHKVEDQEKHPENYALKEIDASYTEDECFYLFSKPRQTQRTVGLYLKKINDDESSLAKETPDQKCEKKRFSLGPGDEELERTVLRNKGFWVDCPGSAAPLIYKLKEKYTVDIEKKTKREQGIFYRPKCLELDYVMKMAKAGLLYPDEEFSDSEEEVLPDDTDCIPLRKVKYKICDPCKEKKEKKMVETPPPKDLTEEMRLKGMKPPFKKIPTGCQCDYYGTHNERPTVWDNPFQDEVDMLRQHEMNKVLRPFKHELFGKYFERHPPVKFLAGMSGMKRTFPVYQISNL